MGMNIHHQTVYNWTIKYTLLIDKYLDKITPKVSTVWQMDEIYLKVMGNTKYLNTYG